MVCLSLGGMPGGGGGGGGGELLGLSLGVCMSLGGYADCMEHMW